MKGQPGEKYVNMRQEENICSLLLVKKGEAGG